MTNQIGKPLKDSMRNSAQASAWYFVSRSVGHSAMSSVVDSVGHSVGSSTWASVVASVKEDLEQTKKGK